MPPIGPAGDEYLKPLNMSAAGQPGADGTVTATPKDPADAVTEEDPGDDD